MKTLTHFCYLTNKFVTVYYISWDIRCSFFFFSSANVHLTCYKIIADLVLSLPFFYTQMRILVKKNNPKKTSKLFSFDSLLQPNFLRFG